jgi:hypothetical protein
MASCPRQSKGRQQIKTAHEPPPLLHPSLADFYRTNVAQLAAALQADGSGLEASETLRGLIDSIVLTPEPPSHEDNGSARYEKVAGNWRPGRPGTNGCGACNRRYLQLWSSAV